MDVCVVKGAGGRGRGRVEGRVVSGGERVERGIHSFYPFQPSSFMQGSWHLFKTLYSSWCHNPVATVSLCLLSQNYDHASNLVQKFADIEITADLLKEIDSLVQLIESPIFAFLRLQLLAPQEHVSLVRTLYGLLMLLPQSSAFSSLKQRLSCVPVITIIDKEGKSKRYMV